MLEITQRLDAHQAAAQTASLTLTLAFEQRQKSRLRTRLDDGTEVGLFLPRGSVLRHGDRLRAADGRIVQVRAAAEQVSTAVADNDPLRLARAAYHLGNRHVPLQLGPDWLRYQRDHVLDQLTRQLGLTLTHEDAPFEPESGAFAHPH